MGDNATVFEMPLDGPVVAERLAPYTCVAFNVDGDKPPLVMIRTWHQEVANYQRLARALGPEQPIYTIGHPVGDDEHDYPSDVDEWRDFCLERLASLDLTAPLLLGGWSFGGVIALESARVLMESGVPVERVVMLDTRIPKRKARQGMHDLQQLAVTLHEFTMLPTRDERRAYLRRRVGDRAQRARDDVRSAARRITTRSDTAPSEQAPKASETPTDLLVRAIYVCYLKYRERKIDVPIVQLWTDESRNRCSGDSTLGWSRVIDGPMHVAGVPGDHLTMFDEPHVQEVAGQLSAVLTPGLADEQESITPTHDTVP